jgi:4-oxalocrotonate tautomerase
MPEITVHMAAGRTPEQKKVLMKNISDAVVSSIGVSIDLVTVQIVEAPLADKMKGGQTFAERAAAKAK